MIQLGRATFLIGCVAFIFIGVLHSYVHFSELAGDALAQRFNNIGLIALQGKTANPWDLFQGVSWLMGFFSIAFGLALIGSFLGTAKNAVPHGLICLSAMLLLTAIAVIGSLYLSSMQLIGGMAGLVCYGIPFALFFFNPNKAAHRSSD